MLLFQRIRSQLFLFMALFAISFISCDDDDVSPSISLSDFEGTWTATSMVHTNNADQGEQFDMIAHGGEVRFTVLSGGRVRTFIELGTYSDSWDSRITLDGDNILRSVPAEAARGQHEFIFELNGDKLMLKNTDAEFDFTLMDNDPVSTTSVGHYELQ